MARITSPLEPELSDSAGNAIGESWLYYYSFAVAVEVLLLALIIRFAWTWPRTQSDADPVNAHQPVAATVGRDPA
jgi:hypothetical protein